MISRKIAAAMEKGSFIRRMFEEGIRLKALYGPDKVYDFSLGNPDLEPPAEVLAAATPGLGLDTEVQEGEDRIGTIALALEDLGVRERLAIVQVVAQRQACGDRCVAEQLRDERSPVHRLEPGRSQDALQAVHDPGVPST